MKTDPAIGLPQQPVSQRFVPRDRESFFEAQRRNRRATWRLSVVSLLATIIMGIPLALTVTPLLYAAALLAADIVSIWTQLPPAVWRNAGELARYGFVALGWLTQGKEANAQALAIGAAVLLLPGAILSVGLWLGINALFQRAGVGGALLALRAREPNPSELKDLQLADVVQEMAIAAGLPAPRIVLIDTPAANAACIGTSPSDARIVVSRGLIERLNRDELEGALAHLVASIGNGDLRIAFRVTTVFETYGLLLALINSPFGSASRRTLWRIVRYAFSRKKTSDGGAAEAAAVAQLLSRSTGLETDDIDRLFDTTARKKSALASIRNFLLFPIFLTNFAIKLSLWFFSLSILEPSMALLWRKRKYLADACAVQLTRNPDALAEALRKINTDRGAIPGGTWAAHLFLIDPVGSDRMNDSKSNAEQRQTLARLWAASAPGSASGTIGNLGPPAPPVPASQNLLNEILTTGRAAVAGDQTALARIMAFRQAAATAIGRPMDELPDVADLIAAERGDKAALRRLRQFSESINENPQPAAPEEQSSGNSGSNLAGFFPSLKRRLKRLDRMGAHVELEASDRKAWIVIAALSLLLGPFAVAAVALLLLLIAILTLSSLTFLAIWMAFIHEIFVALPHH
jgi:Zn-dependent protease with chaperone function